MASIKELLESLQIPKQGDKTLPNNNLKNIINSLR